MKNFRTTIIIFIFTFCTFSCKNEDVLHNENPFSSQIKEFTVSEAENWYLANQKNARINGEGKKPIWNDAIQKQINANQSAIIVPVLMSNPVGYKIRDKRKGKEKDESDNFINADVRVDYVFIKDYTTQQIKQLERRVLTDDDYYFKKKKIKIDAADFDGYAYFFDQNEQFVSGLVYENGKIAGTIGVAPKNAKVTAQVQVCTDWYSRYCFAGICSDYQYTHTTCETYYVESASPAGSTISLVGIAAGSGGGTIADILSISDDLRNRWNQLTQAERNYFTLKPWLLLDAFSAQKRAEVATEYFYCNGYDDRTISNAFKHAFWGATLAMLVGPRTALEMTDAHESDDFTNLRSQMDLHNNDLGINIYKSLSLSNRNETKITEEVLKAVALGKGRYMTSEQATTLTPTNGTTRCK